jgi:nucleoside-diphosphate-sugar epimerase
MKVLVTGAAGFLGIATVERLLAHGDRNIRCFVRPGRDLSQLEALFAKYPDAKPQFVSGDMTKAPDVAKAVKGVDVIYHLAAAMKGTAADMFMNTVVGTKNLLEAMPKTKQPKLVLVSSFSVYGLAGLPRGYLVTESAPLEQNPQRRDPYSHAKIRQEELCRDYQSKLGFPMVVLRPGVIYGPRGGHLFANMGVNLFGVFLHLGRKNQVPLTYVDNCAEAIAIAGHKEESVGETYNVWDSELPTSSEYLKLYRKSVEKVKYVNVPYPVLAGMSKAVATAKRAHNELALEGLYGYNLSQGRARR